MTCDYWTFCLLTETCIKMFLSFAQTAWPKGFFWTVLITSACTFILELLKTKSDTAAESCWFSLFDVYRSLQKSSSVWNVYYSFTAEYSTPNPGIWASLGTLGAFSDTEGLQNRVRLPVWFTGFSMAKTQAQNLKLKITPKSRMVVSVDNISHRKPNTSM